MSTETTNKKIKIDNGTTFGKTYTDKAIDERLQGLVSTATFTPVKEKANNSLQKPAGLTKTKLVGVGTNGQENIEIGDNLTLANGKLSATGGGSSIPVVEGTITSENTFALNETPTGDYFLAHLLYAGFVYVNSLMTKTTVTFGETNIIFYIGLIVLNGVPFLAYSAASEDGSSTNNVMKQICFMNNPYQSDGIIYFANGGFDSLPLPADASTSTYILKAVNGTVQWVKEA